MRQRDLVSPSRRIRHSRSNPSEGYRYRPHLEIVENSANPVVAHAEKKIVLWYQHQPCDTKTMKMSPSSAKGHFTVSQPAIKYAVRTVRTLVVAENASCHDSSSATTKVVNRNWCRNTNSGPSVITCRDPPRKHSVCRLVYMKYQTRRIRRRCDEIGESESCSLLHCQAVRAVVRAGQSLRRRGVSSLENRNGSVAVAAVQCPRFPTCDTYGCWPYIHESS